MYTESFERSTAPYCANNVLFLVQLLLCDSQMKADTRVQSYEYLYVECEDMSVSIIISVYKKFVLGIRLLLYHINRV